MSKVMWVEVETTDEWRKNISGRCLKAAGGDCMTDVKGYKTAIRQDVTHLGRQVTSPKPSTQTI